MDMLEIPSEPSATASPWGVAFACALVVAGVLGIASAMPPPPSAWQATPGISWATFGRHGVANAAASLHHWR